MDSLAFDSTTTPFFCQFWLSKYQDQSNYSDQSQEEQSEFLAISRNLLKAREKSRVQGVINFGLASHWLKNWREILTPITQRSTSTSVIAFDSR